MPIPEFFVLFVNKLRCVKYESIYKGRARVMPTSRRYLHVPPLVQCPLSLALFEESYVKYGKDPTVPNPDHMGKVFCVFAWGWGCWCNAREERRPTAFPLSTGHKSVAKWEDGEKSERTDGSTGSLNITGTGQDMACTLPRHAAPLTDEFNQHLPSKCCPFLYLRFPSLFWLV